MAGVPFLNGLLVNTIDEVSTGVGVTIESLLLKDEILSFPADTVTVKGTTNTVFSGTGAAAAYMYYSGTARIATASGGAAITGTLVASALNAAVTVNVVNYNTSTGDISYNASGGGTTNFLRADGIWAAPTGGSGDVTKVGTPVNNEVAVWTGDGTLEGEQYWTYNSAFSPSSGGGFMKIGSFTPSILSADYVLSISRTITGDGNSMYSDGNAHAYVDESSIDRSNTTGGGIGYNSFDQKPEISGTYDYDHIAGFQARANFDSTGTIDRLTSFQALPTHNGGTAARVTGLEIRDPLGTGTITLNYGIFIKTLTRGGTNAAIVVGDTDADQNLIRVGVTGDPVFWWDESEDEFRMSFGLEIPDLTLGLGPQVDTIEIAVTDDDTHIPTSGAVVAYAAPLQHAMDSATYHTSSDITTLNATTSKHGFLPKLGGGTTNYLRADGTWAAPGSGGEWITDTNGIHYNSAVGIGADSASGIDLFVSGNIYVSDNSDSPISVNKLGADSGFNPSIKVRHETTSTIGDGFGVGMVFFHKGYLVSEGEAGKIAFIRNGANTQYDIELYGANSSGYVKLLGVLYDGQMSLPVYGGGTFTGTATYNIQVDTSGNIIEGALTADDILQWSTNKYERFASNASGKLSASSTAPTNSSVYLTWDGILSSTFLRVNGQVDFLQYGGGTYTGTATYNLQVDTSGNVIEGDIYTTPVDDVLGWNDSTHKYERWNTNASGRLSASATTPTNETENLTWDGIFRATKLYVGSTEITGNGATSPLTTKGDIWVYTTTDARLPAGSSGQVLIADPSGASEGMYWGDGFKPDINGVVLTTTADKVGIGAASVSTTKLLVVGDTMVFDYDGTRTDAHYTTTGGNVLSVGNSAANGIGVLEIVGNRTTEATVGMLVFCNEQSGAADKRIAQMSVTRINDADEGRLRWHIWNSSAAASVVWDAQVTVQTWSISNVDELKLTNTALYPNADNGLQLGTSTLGWNEIYANISNVDNSNAVEFNSSTGQFTYYTQSSDRRLKKDLNPIENPMKAIMSLQGYEFKFNKFAQKNFGANDNTHAGVLAQDVNEVFPTIVQKIRDTEYMRVRYDQITPYLIEGMKEHYLITESHKEKIKRLEKRIKELESKN